jgi:hypothetical protein|tara:strand:- start:426 stop:710 length:285 start_codon:yes stop_codon:yes gene_type:complete
MKNSLTTLHKNLDSKIAELEVEKAHNENLIRDLKKRKLQLKDRIHSQQMDLFIEQDRKHINNMISDQKRRDKEKRATIKRKVRETVQRLNRAVS